MSKAKTERAGKGALVAVYEIGRCYGGPEEGGWWYDVTALVYLRRVRSAAKARKLAERLRREFPQPRHNRFSVIGGDDVYVRTHASPAKVWRDTTRDPRPRYE